MIILHVSIAMLDNMTIQHDPIAMVNNTIVYKTILHLCPTMVDDMVVLT